VEGLIGFFVNTLVLRTQVEREWSFRELLGRVREVCLGGYGHQEVPFEMLVEQLQPERSLSHTPLFQVMFILQNTPTQEAQLPGLEFSAIGTENRTAKFDLSLTAWEEGGVLSGAMEYNTDLFEEETVRRMLVHYETLLRSVVGDAEQKVSEVALLSAAEEQQLLVEWNDTAQDYPAHCIHELFTQQVERTPDAVALIFEEQQISYRELNQRANQLAHYLQRRGVGPDVLVGLMAERSFEMVVGLLGILKAGGAYLPLDPAYPQARLAFMLEDAGARLLLTQARLVSQLQQHGTEVVLLDEDWAAINAESGENATSTTRPENLAYVIYTSGSTGQPKGARGTHGGAVNRFHWMWQRYPFAVGEVCCQKTSLSFGDAVWEVFGPLLAGVRSVLIAQADVSDVRRLAQLIAEHGVSRLVAVPSLLRALLESEAGVERWWESLRYVVSSGEALSRELAGEWVRRVAGSRLLNLYGSSEVSADVTSQEVGAAERGEWGVGIGRPIANTEVYVLDGRLRLVPVGVSGELYVGGAGLARDYLQRAEQTAERFVPHPYSRAGGQRLYRTGDVGRWLADGTLAYQGRMDHQVKVRGYRIELGEVEAAVSLHEGVREAVVVAKEEATGGGKRLVCYCVLEDGAAVSAAELREQVRTHLPEYMIPAALVFLAEMPLTPNGKVDRKALAILENEQTSLKRHFIAARTETEAELTRIWSQVLGVDQISVNDNLFQIGGHSLIATQLLSRVRVSFGVELILRDLFAEPTIEHMAGMVEDAIIAETNLESIDEMLSRLEGLDEDEAERILVLDNNDTMSALGTNVSRLT
jgi:amino acid adenylation domain-containing protein